MSLRRGKRRFFGFQLGFKFRNGLFAALLLFLGFGFCHCRKVGVFEHYAAFVLLVLAHFVKQLGVFGVFHLHLGTDDLLFGRNIGFVVHTVAHADKLLIAFDERALFCAFFPVHYHADNKDYEQYAEHDYKGVQPYIAVTYYAVFVGSNGQRRQYAVDRNVEREHKRARLFCVVYRHAYRKRLRTVFKDGRVIFGRDYNFVIALAVIVVEILCRGAVRRNKVYLIVHRILFAEEVKQFFCRNVRDRIHAAAARVPNTADRLFATGLAVDIDYLIARKRNDHFARADFEHYFQNTAVGRVRIFFDVGVDKTDVHIVLAAVADRACARFYSDIRLRRRNALERHALDKRGIADALFLGAVHIFGEIHGVVNVFARGVFVFAYIAVQHFIVAYLRVEFIGVVKLGLQITYIHILVAYKADVEIAVKHRNIGHVNSKLKMQALSVNRRYKTYNSRSGRNGFDNDRRRALRGFRSINAVARRLNIGNDYLTFERRFDSVVAYSVDGRELIVLRAVYRAAEQADLLGLFDGEHRSDVSFLGESERRYFIENERYYHLFVIVRKRRIARVRKTLNSNVEVDCAVRRGRYGKVSRRKFYVRSARARGFVGEFIVKSVEFGNFIVIGKVYAVAQVLYIRRQVYFCTATDINPVGISHGKFIFCARFRAAVNAVVIFCIRKTQRRLRKHGRNVSRFGNVDIYVARRAFVLGGSLRVDCSAHVRVVRFSAVIGDFVFVVYDIARRTDSGVTHDVVSQTYGRIVLREHHVIKAVNVVKVCRKILYTCNVHAVSRFKVDFDGYGNFYAVDCVDARARQTVELNTSRIGNNYPVRVAVGEDVFINVGVILVVHRGRFAFAQVVVKITVLYLGQCGEPAVCARHCRYCVGFERSVYRIFGGKIFDQFLDAERHVLHCQRIVFVVVVIGIEQRDIGIALVRSVLAYHVGKRFIIDDSRGIRNRKFDFAFFVIVINGFAVCGSFKVALTAETRNVKFQRYFFALGRTQRSDFNTYALVRIGIYDFRCEHVFTLTFRHDFSVIRIYWRKRRGTRRLIFVVQESHAVVGVRQYSVNVADIVFGHKRVERTRAVIAVDPNCVVALVRGGRSVRLPNIKSGVADARRGVFRRSGHGVELNRIVGVDRPVGYSRAVHRAEFVVQFLFVRIALLVVSYTNKFAELGNGKQIIAVTRIYCRKFARGRARRVFDVAEFYLYRRRAVIGFARNAVEVTPYVQFAVLGQRARDVFGGVLHVRYKSVDCAALDLERVGAIQRFFAFGELFARRNRLKRFVGKNLHGSGGVCVGKTFELTFIVVAPAVKFFAANAIANVVAKRNSIVVRADVIRSVKGCALRVDYINYRAVNRKVEFGIRFLSAVILENIDTCVVSIGLRRTTVRTRQAFCNVV